MDNKDKKPVSVLEIIGTATIGGMENQILNFFRNVSLVDFKITCICPCESLFTNELRNLGFEVFITALADDPEWRSVQTAIEVCRLHNVDVIHAHMPKSHVLAAITGSFVRKPVVATVHGMHLTSFELGVALISKSHLITNCQESYIQALALGIPKERVSVFSNAVDIQMYHPTKCGKQLRDDLNVPLGTPLIGFVGRLEFEKGPDLFLLAAAYIHEHRPDAHFAIAGTGSMMPELMQSAAKQQLDQHIHFLEWSTNLSEIYPAFDVVAHTSRSDGTSLVVLEAMSSGKPVVAMAVGGVKDMIENEHTGILVKPGDWQQLGAEIIKLLNHPGLLDDMGKAARIRVENHFNVINNASKIAGVLKSVAMTSTRQSTIE
ncbi:MAG: glycosyltransferase family 1 protein [Ferruginibacter sp.]|uniref:glycosyltransferase family 4 protein n=1 Tax=Ferruginibacter sp. TaxID=1940288 RepID=UPI00265A1562|nr:glycosyltransferase family 4 protein [Ferruginibacter sp.]MDB5279582.1 glycosyltransferase family 1 protein [Ferruginibacter sp.]